MRLQTSSAGLAIGDADNRYFRLAAGNTASKWQHLYCDGADGYTRPSVSVGHTWTDAGNNWTAFKVDAVDSASGSNSKIADFQINGTSKAYFDRGGALVVANSTTTDPMGNGWWIVRNALQYGLSYSFGGNLGLGFFVAGNQAASLTTGFFQFLNAIAIGWAASPTGGSMNTAIERDSDGVVKFTNGFGNLRDWKARRGSLSEYLDIAEMSSPAAPAANTARLYVEDNGSGKTRLMVLFPTGAAQVLATEP